jgi:hypothetical protein
LKDGQKIANDKGIGVGSKKFGLYSRPDFPKNHIFFPDLIGKKSNFQVKQVQILTLPIR